MLPFLFLGDDEYYEEEDEDEVSEEQEVGRKKRKGFKTLLNNAVYEDYKHPEPKKESVSELKTSQKFQTV